VLTVLIVGGRRVWHVAYVANDPVVRRVAGLRRLPVARTIGRWLASFRVRHLSGLQRLNSELVAAAVERLALKRLSIDVDGSVVFRATSLEQIATRAKSFFAMMPNLEQDSEDDGVEQEQEPETGKETANKQRTALCPR